MSKNETMGRIKMIIIIVLVSTITAYTQEEPKNKSGFIPERCKVLFIGSSYFYYNNLPVLFQNLADSSGKKVYIDRQIMNGFYLADHAYSYPTEVKINGNEWDYVILQGVGSITAYPETFTNHPVYPALVALQNKISKNCDSSKMVFCMPWAFEDGMTWYRNWTDTYKDMQIHIYDNILLYSEELGFEIAPVGWAWYRVLEEKNYPLHYLHIIDWNHPSLYGSYLMACVIFSTVFQESIVSNTYYAGLSEDEANYFQTIASNTVLDSLALWNINVTNISRENFPAQDGFYLQQNYPNPFNSSTQIEYRIFKKSHVEISVYDIYGIIYKKLVNDYKLPGSYSVRFSGKDLKSGMYFYKIEIDNQCQIKKMFLIK